MNKIRCTSLLGLAVAAALTGCGTHKAESQTETEVSSTVSDDLILDYEETESEVSLAPITPSDYLVSDAADYLTLGTVEGLPVTQYLYDITDDMVQESVRTDLQMSSIETEVERAAADGDTIYVNLTSTVEGSSDSYTESTYFDLGIEEYGAAFDQELIGLSAGDTKTFSISFDDSAIMEEWMNQTVTFTVTVTSVCEVSEPEYTDAYVQEFFGYDTIEEYEEDLKNYMEEEYADISYSDTITTLLDEAASQSVFNGCPQELYDACKEETLAFYTDYTDTETLEEIYDMFGLTEEDLETEILDLVNRRLLVSLICQEKGIEVTSEDYMSYTEEYAAYYGYDNAASFEADYGRSSIVWTLYESAAGAFLYDTAQITEEPYDESLIDGTDYIEDAEFLTEAVTE